VRSGVENPVRFGIKNVLIRNSSASGGASVLRAEEKTSFAVYHSLGRFLLGNCVRDARHPHLAAWILFINIITLGSNVCHISSNSERRGNIARRRSNRLGAGILYVVREISECASSFLRERLR
jgi:hypothetical protein